jgi:hypothetical protein
MSLGESINFPLKKVQLAVEPGLIIESRVACNNVREAWLECTNGELGESPSAADSL